MTQFVYLSGYVSGAHVKVAHLDCVAVCCSVLQCVGVCCIVL